MLPARVRIEHGRHKVAFVQLRVYALHAVTLEGRGHRQRRRLEALRKKRRDAVPRGPVSIVNLVAVQGLAELP